MKAFHCSLLFAYLLLVNAYLYAEERVVIPLGSWHGEVTTPPIENSRHPRQQGDFNNPPPEYANRRRSPHHDQDYRRGYEEGWEQGYYQRNFNHGAPPPGYNPNQTPQRAEPNYPQTNSTVNWGHSSP